MNGTAQAGAATTAREHFAPRGERPDYSAELRRMLAEAQHDLANLSVQREALALSKKAAVDALAVTGRIKREYDALILRLEVALRDAE